MPMAAPDGYKLERRWSLTHFLIGVFGATAILGVMAKIFTFEAEVFGYLLTWKPVVLVGFMGEALVFILIGRNRGGPARRPALPVQGSRRRAEPSPHPVSLFRPSANATSLSHNL